MEVINNNLQRRVLFNLPISFVVATQSVASANEVSSNKVFDTSLKMTQASLLHKESGADR